MTDIRTTAKPGPTFDAESMRAIRDGRKTQTRRVLPEACQHWTDAEKWIVEHNLEQWGMKLRLPYRTGTVYYARESLCCDDLWVSYRGDGTRVLADHTATGLVRWPWKCHVLAPHCMPRWAARVWLRTTDVRVQRLGEISIADGIAEGLEEFGQWPDRWEQVNGNGSWERDRNKWVAAYTFEILKGDA